MSYACAKFMKTCVRHKLLTIVETKNVKHFKGDEVERKKNVRIICGDGYCGAVLLFLGETKKSVETFMASTNNNKRMKIPNLKNMDSFTDTDSENDKKKNFKRKVDNNNETQKNILNAKLAKMAAVSQPTITSITVPKPAINVSEFDKNVPRPSEKIKELSVNLNRIASTLNVSNFAVDNIIQNENSINFDKIHQRETPLILKTKEDFNNKENETKKNDNNELKLILRKKDIELKKCIIEIKKLKKQLEDEMDQKNDLLLLNMDLQRTVIGQFSNLHSNLKELTSEVTEVANMSGKECADLISAIKGDEIHLGRNIWIKKTVYDAIKGKSRITPALFVKEIALAVFGIDTLLASTVTGKTSNRSKSKKIADAEQEIFKLDPIKLMAIGDITFQWMRVELKKSQMESELEKAKVGKYISHKISEMKRCIKKCEESTAVTSNGAAEEKFCQEIESVEKVEDISLIGNEGDNMEVDESNDKSVASDGDYEFDDLSGNDNDDDSINDNVNDNYQDPLFIEPLNMNDNLFDEKNI
ncbi:uncharacterized protein LOC127290859 [Leptopilina boulardi]|uniref:uncharacterized protein LOC127290859 n=1 Tax=Leptopilina boulardi TaxID=63433 RepID=UPI0021F5B9E6|nr:uncharacterized protein LOC127290859 [Leptopilina boulardi]